MAAAPRHFMSKCAAILFQPDGVVCSTASALVFAFLADWKALGITGYFRRNPSQARDRRKCLFPCSRGRRRPARPVIATVVLMEMPSLTYVIWSLAASAVAPRIIANLKRE